MGMRLATVSACLVGALALSSSARADFVTAYGWVTTEAIAGSGTGATAASLALGTCHNGAGACTTGNADVTFTTTGINFSNNSSTVGNWLASSAFALNGLSDSVSGHLMDATIWEFVGNISVTSPDPFTITHDDGVTFIVNGQTVVNAPGPTSPTPTAGSYTGAASGNAAFQLIYTECCGGPAVLNVSLIGPSNAPVPEPRDSAWLLLALFGVVALVRRRLALSHTKAA